MPLRRGSRRSMPTTLAAIHEVYDELIRPTVHDRW